MPDWPPDFEFSLCIELPDMAEPCIELCIELCMSDCPCIALCMADSPCIEDPELMLSEPDSLCLELLSTWTAVPCEPLSPLPQAANPSVRIVAATIAVKYRMGSPIY